MISEPDMFKPPINRTMRLLDRCFFRKDTCISAARILDIKNMSKIREQLMKSRDILCLRQTLPIQPDPTVTVDLSLSPARKCILLQSDVEYSDKSTWSDTINNLVRAGEVHIIPFTLKLDYNHWTTHEILNAVLPADLLVDMPTAFSHAGHIAQMNLREAYLPYKHLIGEVILDKNPNIRTVINKKDTLGEENEFRVLDYELIAGDNDMQVDAKEWGCTFRFDYSKVFWNSRLSTEHQRLVETYFRKGEAVCDVMAGVGPFAIPAGKQGTFVWANDLNPDCFRYLSDAIAINKVGEFVKPFKEDGHRFIPESAKRLMHDHHVAKTAIKLSRSEILAKDGKFAPRFSEVRQPSTFSHYVMNLPSTAIDFIPDFIGLYAKYSHLFEPHTRVKLPMIHCYCFGPKNDDDDPESMVAKIQICQQLSEKLRYEIKPTMAELEIFDVRDVAPKKRQFCASFRLPPEVAFSLQE